MAIQGQMEGQLTAEKVQELAQMDNVAAALLGHEPTPQEASQIQSQVAQQHGGVVPPGSFAAVVRSEVERGGGPQLTGAQNMTTQTSTQPTTQQQTTAPIQNLAGIENVAQHLLGHEPSRQEAAWIQSQTARQHGGVVPPGSAASVVRSEAERNARGGFGGRGGGAGGGRGATFGRGGGAGLGQ
jgi:hypothetical protein